MSLLRPQVTDARGARRRLLAPPWPGAEEWRRRQAVEQRVRETMSKRQILVFVGAALPAIALGGLAIPAMSAVPGLPVWLAIVIAIPIGAVPALVIGSIGRRVIAHQIVDAYLRSGLCPGCGYHLASTPGEADGCRVCPECGGAWRLPTGSADRPSGTAHPLRD